MKKKFKETQVGKALGAGLKGLFNVAMDVLPLPDVRKYLDKDKDGKYTVNDLRHFKWFEFAGAIVLMSLLLYFKVINMEELKNLIQFLFSLFTQN